METTAKVESKQNSVNEVNVLKSVKKEPILEMSVKSELAHKYSRLSDVCEQAGEVERSDYYSGYSGVYPITT